IKNSKYLHKNWEKVCGIFKLRHDIIHHNKLANFRYSDVRDLVGGTIQFLMCSIMVTNIG
ncbi:MAG TPA: hypothetical protein VLA53_01675, partial [Nitrosopumilaceae archaeon]|nr:hypothetical protein [Nitrosopumilaceae archaeon]